MVTPGVVLIDVVPETMSSTVVTLAGVVVALIVVVWEVVVGGFVVVLVVVCDVVGDCVTGLTEPEPKYNITDIKHAQRGIQC